MKNVAKTLKIGRIFYLDVGRFPLREIQKFQYATKTVKNYLIQ